MNDNATRAHTRGRGRTALSVISILIAAILLPAAVLGGWARMQLVDEDAFVATFAPLIDEPAVQDLIVDETMSVIHQQVDFDELTGEVFDGIVELGLPPRAATALDLLRHPAADGLANLVESTVTRVVASEVFSDVWHTAVRGAHRGVTLVSTSDGAGVIVTTPEGTGVAMGPIIEEIKLTLADRGIAVAALIPAVDHTIVIAGGDALVMTRTAYALADRIGWWLPVITLVLFALGIALARRRSTAMVGAGVAAALGGGLLGTAVAIGSVAIPAIAGEAELSPLALEVIYAQLTDGIRRLSWALAVLGIIVAVIGWLSGSSAGARGTRSAVGSFNASVRRSLAARGLRTGAFGVRLAQYRIAVRVLIAAVAALWVLALEPLTVGGVLLVVFVMLLVAWILEILQVRAEPEPVDAEPEPVRTEPDLAPAEPETAI